ncbi:hypothetical protein BDBG_00214 [Blastomyces gilchristii SLH14081]|uniref:Uncharacterized protein n=1 Tax=Blastomyces gilchristii (strain SLH14081) TaxID=559298 RepID=A0A179U6Z6_BLAGS|nr:uncharacterized protein BDBG_00214 [Blastomyces gilchristii SLH14081]OAT03503.1 hypothetical protein BDBG_00214 [Blastomyces gilchristii SLH14081]
MPERVNNLEHHPTGYELWETKESTPQRPRILNPSSKRIFSSITVSGVRRVYGHHGNQHKEQKRNQYPLPSSQILRPQISSKGSSSHTIPPQHSHDVNN